MSEPFGYFKAEPFGWTDCAETDEGAVALYQHPKECKWPTCQSEEYQQALAEQVQRELVGGQPAQEFVCSTGLCHFKAQRIWTGLTDVEIEDCYGGEINDFARAIEAKLKEKNT